MLKLLGYAVLAAAIGCSGVGAVTKPACQVIDLANTVCKEFIFPDGTKVKMSPEDTRDAVRMQVALKAGGSPGCK